LSRRTWRFIESRLPPLGVGPDGVICPDDARLKRSRQPLAKSSSATRTAKGAPTARRTMPTSVRQIRIQEQTVGDNVGKLPWAAGTGNNLQGLSKRGQKPKEERAQRARRMSLYERRRRSNSLSGDGSRLPNGGNTRVGQRGSGHLAAFSVCLGGRLDKTACTQMTALAARLWANQAWQGCTRTSV
jgi:hypothetical protein